MEDNPTALKSILLLLLLFIYSIDVQYVRSLIYFVV